MKYKLVPNVTLEYVEDSGILVSEKGDAAILNDTGSEIIDLFCKGYDFNHTVEHLANAYGVTEISIVEDIKMFVIELMSKGLLELRE